MREINEKDKTTLDEDASIYAKRDERGPVERFKEMKGAEKWQFFRDYFLWKLIAIIAGIVVLVLLVVKILTPEDEVKINIAVLDDPFSEVAYDTYNARLTEALITGEHQKVTLDTAYYVTNDGYNARTRLMTYIAASEIDSMILPEYEFGNYLESDMYADLESILSADTLNKLKDYLVYKPTRYDEGKTPPPEGSETCYAVKVTDVLNKLNGFELGVDYYMVCVVNSKHRDNFDKAVSVLFEK